MFKTLSRMVSMKSKRIVRAVPREMTMEEHAFCKGLFGRYIITPVGLTTFGDFYDWMDEIEYHYNRNEADGMIVLPSTGDCYRLGKMPFQTRLYIYDETSDGKFKGIIPAFDLTM
jgi:hypothetical protein